MYTDPLWTPSRCGTFSYAVKFMRNYKITVKHQRCHELPNSNSNINEELVININSKINEQTKKHSY
jgi:hypothetical protein